MKRKAEVNPAYMRGPGANCFAQLFLPFVLVKRSAHFKYALKPKLPLADSPPTGGLPVKMSIQALMPALIASGSFSKSGLLTVIIRCFILPTRERAAANASVLTIIGT